MMGLGSLREEEVPETACEITRLPNELLERTLLKLSYAEIAQVRRVCRRFRDVADGILDREFRCLKARAESHLAALVKEENALRGTGSPGRAESAATLPKSPPERYRTDSRELHEAICTEIRLLRAVCYRPLFLSEVPQDIRHSNAYFKGEIIDMTHRILRLVRSRRVETENVRVHISVFRSLADRWIYILNKNFEPTSIQDICAQNILECPDLLGSTVIDILESIPGCKKDITVNMDSGGWCYIKGEYKLHPKFMLILPGPPSALEPLTVQQQAQLQYALFLFARSQCLSYFEWIHCINIYYSHFSPWRYDDLSGFRSIFGPLIFKVDLKCRRKLAPVELLVELLKQQAYEDNAKENAPGAHTGQDSSPDLELKLEIESGSCRFYSRTPLHKYLIRQGTQRVNCASGYRENDGVKMGCGSFLYATNTS
jgi:hypothetical protein